VSNDPGIDRAPHGAPLDLLGDRLDKLGFAHGPEGLGPGRTIHRAAFDEYALVHAVWDGIPKKVVGEIRTRRMLPEVMMGIHGLEFGFEGWLIDLGEPVGSDTCLLSRLCHGLRMPEIAWLTESRGGPRSKGLD
jgi:hypothetical protein